MEQYLNLLEDVGISHVRKRMDRGPHLVKSFGDMFKNMLVNYICRVDLEANQKLLEAQKMNMEKKEKLKFLE
jgi:hypothetical protein